MAITGAPFASIAVLIGGTEFRWADVKRDDDFIRGLLAKEEEFWNYHVLRGIEPPADGSEATKTLLRKLHPADTGAVTELPVEAMQWADQLAIAKSTITEAEADKLLAENRLKQAIGDASIGTLRDGRAFSYKQQTRKAHQVAESTFRVLRPIKAGAR